MKRLFPFHSPAPPPDRLDELLAAALHGELNEAGRAELDARLQNDLAARAAYQETLAMHHLLQENHREVQPDPSFEDRLIAGVRRQARAGASRETPWESALFLWRELSAVLRKPSWKVYACGLAFVLIVAGLTKGPMTSAFKKDRTRVPEQTMQERLADANSSFAVAAQPKPAGQNALDYLTSHLKLADAEQQSSRQQENFAWRNAGKRLGPTESFIANSDDVQARSGADALEQKQTSSPTLAPTAAPIVPPINAPAGTSLAEEKARVDMNAAPTTPTAAPSADAAGVPPAATSGAAPIALAAAPATAPALVPAPPASSPAPARKLVRDAALELEVKSFQSTVDAITTLARADGGYLDSSTSQRGGNGKLQGTVVAKIAPDQLDAFLLRLRELGTVKNQSVSTEDVTKDYYDTQARLDNSHRMETQLQQLLARNNGKVSDLLEVERELGRVRGDIEQMQGRLKLYDFQVQYATVTITVAEKDLHQAAAFLLRENDQFALFVRDVEEAFARAKAAADATQTEILTADLEHGSGNSLSASLAFSVPPDRIDDFLGRVKALGRVDNFTRQTQRVANDGGEASDPAGAARTDRDRVQVQLTIHPDDDSPRQQTQLAVVSAGDIDTQTRGLRDDAAKLGATVTVSNFQRGPDDSETATLSFRLPLSRAGDLLPRMQKLGRVESLTVQRNDPPGAPADDPLEPAEIDLTLHNAPPTRLEDQPPRQATQLAVLSAGDVDLQAQQTRAEAARPAMPSSPPPSSTSPTVPSRPCSPFACRFPRPPPSPRS